MSLRSRRSSRAEISTSASGRAVASASSEPMWSPWAWVNAIRTIGAPTSAAAARIFVALRGSIVSTSVRPSPSRTR
jgi:hypothetical protein